jgi:hypothetical protein
MQRFTELSDGNGMLEAIAALAATASSALVDAMVSDGWHELWERIARLLGRGDRKKTQDVLARLEQSQRALVEGPAVEAEQARARQIALWQAWLVGLLASDPQAEAIVRAFVQELDGHDRFVQVTQQVTGSDQAQQAVLGTGMQTVNFGENNGPHRP